MKNNVIFSIVNRNEVALCVNNSTGKYSKFSGATTSKAGLRVICKLLEAISNDVDKYDSITVLLPKNMGFILRKESVYEWINNGGVTGKGTKLDDEFIELCKYISDMRFWFIKNKVKVSFKMTGTTIMKPEEEIYMKKAWDLFDRVTGYKANKQNIYKPEVPSFMR